jgi:DNA-binding XRE family transcriptional regulator
MPKQNTKPADYPQAVIQQIELLAQNIVMARKRRNETQAQWAKKLGVSQPTMARIERGDPAVAMASYVMCMWLVNQAAGLADLIAPQNDHASLAREVTKVRSRGLAVTPVSSANPVEAHAAGLNTRHAATQPAKTAAGLAALLSKAEPKSR